jgi:hypothetical protein
MVTKARSKRSAWNKTLVSQEVTSLCGLSRKLNIINNLPAEKYMERFARAAKRHGFRARYLSGGRCVYYLGRGPGKVAIISGIHGEERSGPVSLLTWLEGNKRGSLIPKKVSLLVCPLVGHDAWNNKTRLENGRMNLNSVWAKERAPGYIHELKREIKNFDPSVFVDIHEDCTIKDKEPYLFRNKRVKGMIRGLQVALGVSRKKGLWESPEYKGTSETFVFDLGCKETTTLETPQTKPIKSRVGFDLAAIKWIIEHL